MRCVLSSSPSSPWLHLLLSVGSFIPIQRSLLLPVGFRYEPVSNVSVRRYWFSIQRILATYPKLFLCYDPGEYCHLSFPFPRPGFSTLFIIQRFHKYYTWGLCFLLSCLEVTSTRQRTIHPLDARYFSGVNELPQLS